MLQQQTRTDRDATQGDNRQEQRWQPRIEDIHDKQRKKDKHWPTSDIEHNRVK